MRSRSSNSEKNSIFRGGSASQSRTVQGSSEQRAFSLGSQGLETRGYDSNRVSDGFRGAGGLRGENRASSGSWVLQLSVSQVLVMWSVIAGVMILSFLFGLFAGREQGLETALEEYRQQGARIPVAEPQAVTEEAKEVISAIDNQSSRELTEVASLPNSRPNEGPAGVSAAGQNTIQNGSKDPSDQLVRNPDGIFDFSDSRVDPTSGKDSALERKSDLPASAVQDSQVASAQKGAPKATGLFASSNPQPITGSQSATVDAAIPSLGSPAASGAVSGEINSSASASKGVDPKTRTETATNKKEVSSPKQVEQKQAASKETNSSQKIGTPGSGWYVQVAATRVPAQAAEVIALCKKSGFEVAREVAKVREASYYRVLVGPYPTREAALKVKEQVKRKQISKTEPFLKRIR